MKKIAAIMIMLVIGACGEQMMPTGYSGLVLGMGMDQTLEDLGLQNAKPEVSEVTDFIDYEKALTDELYKEIKVGFKYRRLASVEFSVRDDRCSEDLYHGIRHAVDKKTSCKGMMEENNGLRASNWEACLAKTGSVDNITLLFAGEKGKECGISLIYTTNRAAQWEPQGEKVEL